MAPEPQTDATSVPAVRIHAALVPKLNLAFHQNSLPTLREATIINDGDSALQDLELTLSSSPVLLKAKTWHIDSIGPRHRYPIPNLDVTLNGPLLVRLTEAEMAQANFVLTAQGKEIARFETPIELLAHNQWGGIGHLPEMVAAFVQPNDPAVERILKKAAAVLHQHGKSSALNGYEGGPKRAWELVSAIWTAIGAMALDYALPPASFEYAGQKIRGPSQVTEAGLATCLDTALLFCAALEQCGLNPLIVFTHGHALAGVWLKAEDFSTAVVDDVTALRKRVRLNELVLFETTAITHRPCPTFSRAAELGAQQIAETREDSFELAVDIRRARLQRIRPLASAEASSPAEPAAAPGTVEPVFEEAPDLPDEDIVSTQPADRGKPEDRLGRWQRKLLDLSLRNTLLNFRAGKKVIRFDAPDPGRLEDALASGHALSLLPRPELMEGSNPRSQAIHEARSHEDLRRSHALDALDRNEVFVGLPRSEMDARLVELYRSARTALQEGGANTLFLALGFLSWTRDDKDDKRYRAPLILIPVTLQRKSVRSGFSLVLHDDEPRFNPTLLEMLRQDFKLVIPVAEGEIPKDDHGIDVPGIWRAVGRAVKDIKGWEVIEDVVLATFSFAKHLMWKDLVDRTDQLKRNAVVRHLIETPRDPYVSAVAFPDPRELDSTLDPERTFCPLPADSSQLSAVMAAAMGKDFVLVGPPGTGKSQTIANLIAQCLAERKTVLFVSEKMAALDVVYRRLRDVGLGDFCLELHSSKARKLDVLDQLRRAWDAQGAVDVGEWHKEAQRLKALRGQLNTFAEHLHRQRRNGLTAYLAIGRVLKGRNLPELGLSWPSSEVHDAEALDALLDLAERLEVDAHEVGVIANSPLSVIARSDWSPNWQQSLVKTTRDLLSVTAELEQTAAAFCQAAGFPQMKMDRHVHSGLATLAQLLPKAAGHDWRFSLHPDAQMLSERLRQGLVLVNRHRELIGQFSAPYASDVIEALKKGLDLLARYGAIYSELSVPYRREVIHLDARQLQAGWSKAERSWWPISFLLRRAVRTALTAAVDGRYEPEIAVDIGRLVNLQALASEIAALDPLRARTDNLWAGLDTQPEYVEAALAFQAILSAALAGEPWQREGLSAVADGRCGASMAADLERLRQLRTLERQVSEFNYLQFETGGLWKGLWSLPDEIEQVLTFQVELSQALSAVAHTTDTLAAVRSALDRLLGDGNALLGPAGPLATAGTAYVEALERFQYAAIQFAKLAGVTPDDLLSSLGDAPGAIAQASRGILSLEPKLRAWCAWSKARGEANTLGLAPLVKGIEEGKVALGKVREVLEANYCRWWLNALVDGDDVLRDFVSAEHEKRIADFRALDDRFTKLTRAYIRANLCADLPNQDNVAKNSEWGVLRHEMQKKKRHMPLRELMKQLPNTVTKLTPCMLMSPLSIAQYLSAETAMFDVVVFDEASQIPVWDAIGAIARGKQVVMVGDPKQLPPTSFFDRVESDADDEDVDGDLESILDECLGANLPTQNLSWHYRSRHESLIAFSNHRYYGGGLVTFPSPVTEDRAVSFHLVQRGVYEKGGDRVNKPEARALVADLVARLKEPDFNAAGLTIGVVTFNSEQQRLIEDLLDEERRKSPAIEPHFAEGALEPVFVKNLESVQGDERDLMYFSITYGPDHSGAISMNFGPMNRDGGERRLNVAITRARQELRVFSSLKPDQIDLSRTQAAGVRDLKHFLEFAERGPRALAEAIFGTIGDYDSPFEKAVATALTNNGWVVHPQVGVSSFRIDLGVVDPDAPGRYLAGIECDGATYHRSATARDRDKLREQVLRGLGWDIIRIWSTDWWVDTSGALEKVHAQLESLLQASRAHRAMETRTSATKEDAAVPDGELVGEGVYEVQGLQARSAIPVSINRDKAPPRNNDHQIIDRAVYARNAMEAPPTAKPVFHEAGTEGALSRANPDAFFERNYDATLRAMIAHVVTVEGPVREDVLAKRIARAHGWARTGTRIQDRVLEMARQLFPMSTEDVGVFFWPWGADTNRWPTFRRPLGDGITRPVDEIALQELVALVRELRVQGMDGEQAIALMAREVGLQKLRTASRMRLRCAWREANAGNVGAPT